MIASEKQTAVDLLVAELRPRRGREQAISSRELSQMLQRNSIALNSRAVRELLSEQEKLDTFPLLLGACGGDGYYVAANVSDIIQRVGRWMDNCERLSMLINALTRRAKLEGFDLDKMRKPKAEAAAKEAA